MDSSDPSSGQKQKYDKKKSAVILSENKRFLARLDQRSLIIKIFQGLKFKESVVGKIVLI
jgi:hypothetical protein